MENRIKTVYFLGAGSTVRLKMPQTNSQIEQIWEKIDSPSDSPLGQMKKAMDDMFGSDITMGDVYNIIDSRIALNTGLYHKDVCLSNEELREAKKGLIQFVFKRFREIIRERDRKVYEKLVHFYEELARKELEEKGRDADDMQSRDFYVADHSIINLNWDLYSLMPMIEANRRVNKRPGRWIVGNPNAELRIYTDFNCECASSTDKDDLWYPYTEAVAYRVNDKAYASKRRVVLVKALYPHGQMNLYRCPNCGKHSYYMGGLDIDSVLSAMERDVVYNCPYCNVDIKKWDVDVLVQSNFKVRNSYLEEQRLEMLRVLEQADRIVFIGYSLPQDDVDNRSLFKSIAKGKEIYVALCNEKYAERGFRTYQDPRSIDESAGNFDDVFKKAKFVKFNFRGAPDAFEDILEIK